MGALLKQRRRNIRYGFTIIELMIVIVVLSLLAAGILIPAIHRSRSGAYYIKCRTQLKQIHSAMILWSGSNQNRFPTPLEFDAATANASVASGNSTANLHSLLIFQNYYSPELPVCPQEANRNIKEDFDFDYGDADSSLDLTMNWDPNFDCEITGKGGRESNVSYANLAPTGDRFKNEWQDTLNSSFAVLSDRGPRDGISDPASTSYNVHGSQTAWSGNVVYNDNHVEGMSENRNADTAPFAPTVIWFLNASGKGLPDNLFFEDDTTNHADIWLSIFVRSTVDPSAYFPLWD